MKYLKTGLAITLAATLLFTGCGRKHNESPDETSKGAQEPVLKTLKVYANFNANAAVGCKTYNDNLVFQEMEKRTGVKVEWIHPAIGQEKEQFNLMIASKDLPDVINYSISTQPGGARKYFNDGIIIKMNDLIKKNAPNFDKIISENPEVKKQLTDDEGSFFYMPQIRLDESLRVFLGFQLRQDWMNKLGLKTPETINDLYNVMKAFKEKDPNGNGKADEIPYSAAGFTSVNGLGKLLWAWNVHWDFYQQNNKVKFGPMEPEFKEGLQFLNKMYKEGLLDPDYVLNDRTKMDEKVMNHQVGIIYSFQPRRLMTTMASKSSEFKIEGIPFPKGPKGTNAAFEKDFINAVDNNFELYITTVNKNPAGTLKWLDYAYGPEGHLLFNFGVEGYTYKVADNKKAYTEIITKNPDGLNESAARAKYIMALNGWALVQDKEYQAHPEYSARAISIWKTVPKQGTLPSLTYTADETSKIASKMSEIKTYTEEMFDKFVYGKESLDNYDRFTDRIKQMGIEEILKVQQQALDRYNKK